MGTQIDKTNNKIKLIADNGMVVPVLTTTERNAIISPENGHLIFNSTDGELQVYDGSWGSIGGGGSSTRTVVSKAFADSPYSASVGEDVLVDCTNGDVTVNLPTASGNSGQTIMIKKTDNTVNTVTIDANSTETIDGNLTLVISGQYDSFELVADGTNWHIR